MDLLKIFSKKTPSAKKPSPSQGIDLHHIKPYGDLLGDGAMQLSFTLPMAASPEAREAAKIYIEKLGLKKVFVASMEPIGKQLSYFVVYGHATHSLDATRIKVSKVPFAALDFESIEKMAREKFRKKIVVVGATTGTDAHTVGLDAIMNMKGYMGDHGLERYDCFRTYNLRSQISHGELIAKAVKLKADVLLVSKVVTQRGGHLEELKELARQIKKEKLLPSHLITIVGGPRMSHAEAAKMGFDAGFGPGTLPSQVASYIVQEYSRRIKS